MKMENRKRTGRFFRELQIVVLASLFAARAALGQMTPWAGGDVGAVGVAGSSSGSAETGAFTLSASGADIWEFVDAFHFVHQILAGDGEIVTRVDSLQNTSAWAKAGVMIRASLAANSPHACMIVTPTNGASFQRRTETGGTSALTGGGAGGAPLWVKLKRSGTAITGYRSPDGVAWTAIDTVEIPMGFEVYAGLAVTSHENTVLATATFSHAALTPVPAGNGLRGEYFGDAQLLQLAVTREDGAVDFNWGASAPDAAVGADHFSVRWFGEVEPPASGTYTFHTLSDDHVRLWVGGQVLIDNWTAHSPTENSGAITLAAGTRYPIRLEYVEVTGGAVARLSWSGPNLPKEVIPASRLFQPEPTLDSDGDGLPDIWELQHFSDLYPNAEGDFDQDGLSNAMELDLGLAPATAFTGGGTTPDGSKDADGDGYSNAWEAAAGTDPRDAADHPGASEIDLWQQTGIGALTFPGGATRDAESGEFTLAASGADIWETADAFRFVHQPLEGDGEIVARVISLQNTSPWAKAGVMMRESLDANARNALMLLSAGNGTSFQWRAAPGGTSLYLSDGAGSAPTWVKLARSGTLLTGFRSADGLAWTPVSSAEVPMAFDAHVGLALTSHNAGVLSVAAFDQVTVTPLPAGQGLRGEYFHGLDLQNLAVIREDGAINFTWTGAAPDAALGTEHFSVRWLGTVEPAFTESYTFSTLSDDHVRLWIGEQLLIDNWTPHAPTENSGTLALAAGTRYPVRLEYAQVTGGAVAKLSWSSPSRPKQIIPATRLYQPDPATLDSDLDGMPDVWEELYGLNPLGDDSGSDLDQDGVSALVEFLQGRNPTKGAVADTGGTAVRLLVFTRLE